MDIFDDGVPNHKVEAGRALMDRLQMELGADTLIVAFNTGNGAEVMAEGQAQDLIGLVSTAFLQLGMTAVMRSSKEHVEDRRERVGQ